MRMSGRTSPTDVLERLAWHLNYHVGEKISTNSVAESTDLHWATVKKYSKCLEIIQKIAPHISVEQDGIKIGTQSGLVSELMEAPTTALAVYILNHAEDKGGSTEPLSTSNHSEVLDRYSDTVEKMESLGWISRSGDGVQLTPLGVGIAGPARSKVVNAQVNPHDQILVYREGSEITAVLGSEFEGEKESETSPRPRDVGNQSKEFGAAKSQGQDEDYHQVEFTARTEGAATT